MSYYKILFVCTGNICRSPMSQGVFQDLIMQNGLSASFKVDSAGVCDYHVGENSDLRALQTMHTHHISLNHTARRFIPSDLTKFDYILVMDHLNYEAIFPLAKTSNEQQKIMLFRSFDLDNNQNYDVPDPYYGSLEDFHEVYNIVRRSSIGFLNFLKLGLNQIPMQCN